MLRSTTGIGISSSNLGRAYLAQGRALQALTKLEQARDAFRSAAEQLESTLGVDHPDTILARQLAEPVAARL
jgi:tetratricopeptide (TPR) repeat protein